jgi:hypothetical protein
MTTLCDAAAHTLPTAGREHPARRPRCIAVGVRDREHDRAAIAWAIADAVAGTDQLHLVHAYVPLLLDGGTWDPAACARDTRYVAARRVVGQAVRRVMAGQYGVACTGSVIAGLPDDVMHELSDVVDLIVIGDDSASAGARTITWRVQDRARCPVVGVPANARGVPDARPVTVLADDRGLSEAALRFGAEAALRHGVGLEVSRAWSSLHLGPPRGPTWLAEQQEELDAQLAGWRVDFPGLPVVARIETDDRWAPRLHGISSLLVAPSSAVPLLRAGTAGYRAPCPIAVIPC